jgi:predicted ATPase
MREEVRESPESEAAILRHLACLHAIVGQFAVARELINKSNATYAELGLTLHLASSEEHVAIVELLAGKPAAAETSLRAAYRTLEEMGERAFRSTIAATLALVILEQGRSEEAEALVEVSARLAATGDLLTQIRWRRVRARALASRADIQGAEALAREALEIAEKTDFINERADTLIDLSLVLEASRRFDEVAAAASKAVQLYKLKGNVVAVAKTGLRPGKIIGM